MLGAAFLALVLLFLAAFLIVVFCLAFAAMVLLVELVEGPALPVYQSKAQEQ
jgi:hypothetical protein